MKHSLTAFPLSSGLALISGAALADGGYGSDHAMMSGNWVMGPMMMLLMLIIVVVAIVIVLKAFGIGGSANGKMNVQDNARATLNERFAKGEIDKAEYEDRKKTLDA